MSKRFVTPFAASGDKLAVPDATQPDGSVSYNVGFGVDYQRPIGDPLRKTMPRDSTNQLFFDLTEFAKELQENGAGLWRNDVDYVVGSVTLGSNGTLYRAIQASGPSTTPRDPVTQLAYWASFVTGIHGNVVENPPSIPAGGAHTFTVPVPGAVIGSPVSFAHSGDITWNTSPTIIKAYVSAADVVSVSIHNASTVGSVNLASTTFRVVVFNP